MAGTQQALDLVVVGAGILGLAHALAAVRRGWRVAVVERDAQAVGASVRNFGFVTVSGQSADGSWQRARRSRDVWLDMAQAAGIPVQHRGAWLVARRPAAFDVLQAFQAGPMGDGCELHTAAGVAQRAPWVRSDGLAGALYSPHELRVESREALPRLAAWLAEAHGVQFYFGEEALERTATGLRTAQRSLAAPRVVVCPGTGLQGFARPWLAAHPLRLCRLQMLRWQPARPFHQSAALMTDLSLVRYGGFAALPQAQALRQQLQDEAGPLLADGIHLIAVQSADGSLVVGDSHHDEAAEAPFASEAVDAQIVQLLQQHLAAPEGRVVGRWLGHYPRGLPTDCLVIAPEPGTRVALVTGGNGASTAFAIAEDTLAAW